MKKCTICGDLKSHTEFHKQTSHKDGLANWCKPCKKEKKAQKYLENRDKVLKKCAEYRKLNPEKVSQAKARCYRNKKPQYQQHAREYYLANRESALSSAAIYRAENRQSINQKNKEYKSRDRRLFSEKQKQYYRENRAERIRYASQYVRRKLDTDPRYVLAYRLRRRLTLALAKRGYTKQSKTTDLLGCDWDTLKKHIESQFRPGMSWENRKEWHVDHKFPLARAEDEAAMTRLFHYTNLQPLWAADNLSKGARVII